MAQYPYLPLFCDSWTLDTKHLSRAERGTYLDLLMLMWTTPQCRVPNDRKWIEDRLGYPRGDELLAKIIKEFCRHIGRHWIVQKRLRREYLYLGKQSTLQRKRALGRNRNKKSSEEQTAQPIEKQRNGLQPEPHTAKNRLGSRPRKPLNGNGIDSCPHTHTHTHRDSTPLSPPSKGGAKSRRTRHGKINRHEQLEQALEIRRRERERGS